MKPTKPYLARAMHEWIVDSGMTPHLVARADEEGIEVPPQAIQDGRVTLNTSPEAVRDLLIDDQGVSFIARFGGVSQAVWLPIASLEGIYAKENGRGMLFGEDEPDAEAAGEGDPARDSSDRPTGPTLRVVK